MPSSGCRAYIDHTAAPDLTAAPGRGVSADAMLTKFLCTLPCVSAVTDLTIELFDVQLHSESGPRR